MKAPSLLLVDLVVQEMMKIVASVGPKVQAYINNGLDIVMPMERIYFGVYWRKGESTSRMYGARH